MLLIRISAALIVVTGRIWLDHFNEISIKVSLPTSCCDWVLKFKSDKAAYYTVRIVSLENTPIVQLIRN